MNTFIGFCRVPWNGGGADYRYCVVKAICESKALDLFLTAYPDTVAANWTVKELGSGVELIASQTA